MPSVATTGSTKSGIIESENGERHIPASVRPDGTQRKEIRVRPGYRPPEDVEVYKNRTAEGFRTRGSGGVPGAVPVNIEESKSNNKNRKRREARKKAKAAEGGSPNHEQVESVDGRVKSVSGEKTGDSEIVQTTLPVVASETDSAAEKEKQAKKLRKKLREARELQEKKQKGESLLQEQFEKVFRINELIRDLEKLGFDANGELKTS
jgi:partner of Y14 and mago protein